MAVGDLGVMVDSYSPISDYMLFITVLVCYRLQSIEDFVSVLWTS